jgi:hypothetical protein
LVALDHSRFWFSRRGPRGSVVVALCAIACSSLTAKARGQEEPPTVFSPAGQSSTAQSSQDQSTATPQVITIPDGTQVQLRLADPVRGMRRTIRGTRVYSKPGDKIRLVAADDLRVNGLVVIAKGAVGQATVITADPPPIETYSYNDRYAALVDIFVPKTGSVSLYLDWIKDVTGHAIRLRAYPVGEAKPFTMVVLAENGGLVTRPPKLRQDLKSFAHAKQWAPAGTRLSGFVHGEIKIDLTELKDAQGLLPISNPTAILTIFRDKGHREVLPRVSCDDKDIATLGEREYINLELAPGKHSCHSDGQPAMEFTVEAGEDYFIRVQYKGFSSVWELKMLTAAEGEDSVSSLEPAGKASEESATSGPPTVTETKR